jgi:hypothetical protein
VIEPGRKQDWLSWPADVFDRDLLAFHQEKTSNSLVLPWRLVPALAQRMAATTFFRDSAGRPWKNGDAFNELRDRLSKKHPSFATRYYAGIDPENPPRLPTKKLTMRTTRNTCI